MPPAPTRQPEAGAPPAANPLPASPPRSRVLPSTNKPAEQPPQARFQRYREPRFQPWPRWPVRRLRLPWNHEALPSKDVFPMVLTCPIHPFLRVEIRFGRYRERLCDRMARVFCDYRAPSADRSASSSMFCAYHALSVTLSTSSGSKGAPNRRSNAPRFKTSAQRRSSARGEDTIRLGRTATRSSPVSKSFHSPSGRECWQITTGISR